MLRSLRVSLITASMGFVLGCNDGSRNNIEAVDKGSQEVTISAHKKHHNKTMNLESRIREIYSMKSSSGDTCYLSQKSKLLQLARDLDRFARKSQSSVSHSHIYSVNSSEIATSDRWVTIEDSWEKVLKTYNRIRGKKSTSSWQKLLNRFNTLVLEDTKRLKYRVHPLLSRDMEDRVRAAKEEVKLCQIHYSCYEYDFSQETISYLKASPMHHKAWTGFFEAKSRETQVAALDELLKLLNNDLKRYEFTAHPNIQFSDKTLQLPINTDGLSQELIELLQSASDLWSEGSYNIELIDDDMGFKIHDHRGSPGRSYVNLSDRSIHLYGTPSVKTLAHELGHVIGFDDHYYTSFDEVTCRYQFELNSSDLMSSVKSGQIQSKHWTKIKEKY